MNGNGRKNESEERASPIPTGTGQRERRGSVIFDCILKLCKDRGISVAKLERETGISNGTISKWNTSSPSVKNIKAVADYFGITVDELISSAPISQMEQ